MLSKSHLVIPLLKVAELEYKAVGPLKRKFIRLRIALCPTSGFSSSLMPTGLAFLSADLRLGLHFDELVRLCPTDEVARNLLAVISNCQPLPIR